MVDNSKKLVDHLETTIVNIKRQFKESIVIKRKKLTKIQKNVVKKFLKELKRSII